MERHYGRTRAVKGLYDNILTDFENPALLIIQYLGFFVFILVALSQYAFQATGAANDFSIPAWLILYGSYNFLLWSIHRKKIYDHPNFRFFRQCLNICLYSWLFSIAPNLRFVFFLLYLIPTFATRIYYPDTALPSIVMFILSGAGMFLSGMLFSPSEPMTSLQYFSALSLLFLFNLFLWVSVRQRAKKPPLLETITNELDQKAELDEIYSKVFEFFSDLLLIDHALILLKNICQDADEYFSHDCRGISIPQKQLILDYLVKSRIIQTGKGLTELADEAHEEEIIFLKNMLSGVPDFQHALGEPLLGRDGRVYGVILLFPEQRINLVEANLARQICSIAGNAIENWFFYRQMKISQTRITTLTGEFSLCLDEENVIQVLIQNVKKSIPAVEECFVHRYDYVSERLDPKTSLTGGILVPWKVKNRPSASGKLKMNLHSGIAGNTLRLKEPIRVADITCHPWFRGQPKENITSLLAAPLIGKDEKLIGAISLNSPKTNAFSLKDEIILAELAQQASSAFSKLRTLSELREHGSLLLNVINRIGRFDLNRSREAVCSQIVEAATETLGFEIARIRLLNRSTNDLETIQAAGVSESDCTQLRSQPLPYDALKPQLQNKNRYGNVFLFDHEDEEWRRFAEQYLYVPDELRNKQTGWRAYNACLAKLKNQDGETLGFLSLDCPKDGTIPNEPHRLDAIEAFASLSARALELANVQQELVEKQTSTRAFIGKISERLAQSEDVLRDVGEIVVQTGANLLNVEGCSLFEVKDKKTRLINSNYLDMYVDRQRPVSTEPRCGLTAWVAATGEARIFNNGSHQQHPAWAGEVAHLALLPHPLCFSLMFVPIKRGQEVIGVISLENKVHSGQITGFSESDLKEAEFLANQVALSIDVVNRYQLIKKWERFGLEDDLHALKNYSHYGVVTTSEVALKYLREQKFDKTLEVLEALVRDSRNVHNQLTTLYATVTRKYLEKADIQEALEAIFEVWEEVLYHQKKYKSDLPIHIDCPPNLILPPVVRVGLLKIAAEAITNALFYSGILKSPEIRISISLQVEDGEAVLEVLDNGHGFNTEMTGYGIQRMRDFSGVLNKERYKTRLLIDSEPGNGTRVTCVTKIAPFK